MEGVGVGPDHHHHLLERVGASTELSPVDPVLVAAPVVAPAVPDPVEVGVGAGVIPPAALLVVGTVACRRERARRSGRRFDLCPLFALGGLPRDPCPLFSNCVTHLCLFIVSFFFVFVDCISCVKCFLHLLLSIVKSLEQLCYHYSKFSFSLFAYFLFVYLDL